MKAFMNLQPLSAAPPRRKGAGFTLIELMIVLAVAGVLISIGLPSLRTFIEGQRVKTASYDIHSALILARSEAIKRNDPVTITPASGTNWKNGWTISAGAAVIARQDAYPSANLAISGPASVIYNGNGRLPTGTVATITVTNTKVTRASSINIDLSGLPRTTNSF